MSNDADEDTRALIRQLAEQPERVQVDAHATGNMLARRLSLDDVLDAICAYIDDGGRIKATVIKTHPKALVGQPAYEAKPDIEGRRFYVRLALRKPAQGDELLVLSVHLDV